MSELAISIPGNPIAKKRPRFARKGKFVTTYNDQQTEEGRVLWEIKRQLPSDWSIIKTPISISTLFCMKRPKSHYGTGSNSDKIKKNAPDIHFIKPDLDNLQKFIFDCFNGLVWTDDSLVYDEYSCKKYAKDPCTKIVVRW